MLQWLGGPVAKLAYLALLVAFAVLALHCLVRRPSPLAPLVVIAAGYPFLLAVPEASQYVGEPRYALFLAPILALLLAAGVCRLARAPALQAAVLALAALGTVSSLHAIQVWSRASPGHWDLAAPVTGPAQDDLERSHTRFAYGEYWVAYPITLGSHERVVVTPYDVVRYEPYRQAALAAGEATISKAPSMTANVSALRALEICMSIPREAGAARKAPHQGAELYAFVLNTGDWFLVASFAGAVGARLTRRRRFWASIPRRFTENARSSDIPTTGVSGSGKLQDARLTNRA